MGGSLAAAGHKVVVFEMQSAAASSHEIVGGMEIRRVPVPTRFETEDMSTFATVCPAAAEIIGRCDPRVLNDAGMSRWSGDPRRAYGAIRRRLRARLNGAASGEFDERAEILSIRSIMLIDLAIYKLAETYRPSVVHCNDLDTLLIGFMFKKNHRVPVMYDAHEIYPEQLARASRPPAWHNFYTMLERLLINQTDGRMTVCDSLGAYFVRTYGSKSFKTVLNVPSVAYLAPPAVLSRRRQRRKFLYHGAYAAHRGLEEVIRASRHVDNGEFVFRGIGSHGLKLKELCRTEAVEDRITFVPPVPVAEMIPAAADCDIGLNPFVPVCKNTEYALPNKFFEYMMAGLCCASSDLVEMRRLTRELGVGTTFPSLEPIDIAASLNELLADPAKIDEYRHNAYAAARTKFNWEHEEHEFIDYYSEFLN
jgi:glycosyltransferase involved in cell wall biosynthesis